MSENPYQDPQINRLTALGSAAITEATLFYEATSTEARAEHRERLHALAKELAAEIPEEPWVAVLAAAQAGGGFAAAIGQVKGFKASEATLRAQTNLFLRQTLEGDSNDE